MKKHTKGLLVAMPGNSGPRLCIEGDKGWPIVVMVAGPTIAEAKINEARMAACWNAMDGIDDPAAARVILDEPQTLHARDLLAMLKEVICVCQCTFKQRDSGHLVDCPVPRAIELIKEVEGE